MVAGVVAGALAEAGAMEASEDGAGVEVTEGAEEAGVTEEVEADLASTLVQPLARRPPLTIRSGRTRACVGCWAH